MNEERILYLFTRKLAGTLTSDESTELESLLILHPAMVQKLQLLEQFWNDRTQTSTVNVEVSLQKVMRQIHALPAEAEFVEEKDSAISIGKTSWSVWRWLSAAAIVGLVLVSAWVGYQYSGLSRHISLIEKKNAKGVKSTIELPDGSKIWLNADSRITYPQAFNEKTREVHLYGEAFFDIRKNPSKPFIIHLTQGTVRVLGTSFNIRAYEDEDKIETSVATGKVAFIPKAATQLTSDTVFLRPNQKVLYSFRSGRLITQATQSTDDKAWIEGRLIFKSMTLEEIAQQLARNFGKKVVFRSEEAKKYRLTGAFSNNTLEEIMFYLSKTRDFSYQITNEELVIGENSQQPGISEETDQ
ncbi:FecR domain-containing protein [Cytophagaceae bacterium DM2B3-1]|uniref:FecR domain-containing protein n=1 Tax=Xanthocytophaga flava TaxID=3048013 RepID=A0ABT7CRT3_9BACT|nr:FecR domain-containing protein [Xanthocytophaga flavus]MDJ1466879.1 FecR domain-containing protein [Xanthocytophaga flavus]MDJ1496221.1 FecR domain-containing protein [Xanthocytophaga flavus]